MNKTCPDCEGKKGKWRHTHSSINPAYPHVFIDCKTCKGKGTIPEDKIRGEFKPFDIFHVKITKEERDSNIDYTLLRCEEYIKKLEAGYKSRDEEIKELKDNFEACDKQRLRFLKEKADVEIYKNAKIKKLRDVLEGIGNYAKTSEWHEPGDYTQIYDELIQDAREVLKDGE